MQTSIINLRRICFPYIELVASLTS